MDQYFEDLLNLVNLYSNSETCKKYYVFSLIFRQIFEKLCRENNYNLGFQFFLKISENYEKNQFNNSKAYSVYFAYQLKSYEKIEDIMNTIYFEIKNDYKDWKDFYLMNFYKGLIFLTLKVNIILIFRIIQTHLLAF
jgi:hypothetical protein